MCKWNQVHHLHIVDYDIPKIAPMAKLDNYNQKQIIIK